MLLIVTKYLIPNGYRGMTVFPFVFIKYKEDRGNLVLLNHEKIHLRQQLELLIVPFYVWYFLEYIIRLLHYRNSNLAYRNISFEREAYANEFDSLYLQKRVFWNFYFYLKIKK
ncbi:hypothetical protein SAMN05444396_104170 [Flavobacterium segetis]|uniref:Peptidase M56 domain-containing protein n=1 Tax=Flavobacterium segetis TaxID=271157 RepID=A0A1M5GUM9_9FLAO|nr:hypothetical protein [Flavobacterium segetis]SHG07446.1 hypothetical protein SAMN05444396_104170 [Flavobacterium segetis]